MDLNEPGIWMPIGAAAEAAGANRRSAFRWASRGLMPVRKVGRRRLVEVRALAAVSGMRGKSASLSLFGATARDLAEYAPYPAAEAGTAALEDAILMLQEQVALMEHRLAEVERLIGAGG